jgi:hypothetical protein
MKRLMLTVALLLFSTMSFAAKWATPMVCTYDPTGAPAAGVVPVVESAIRHAIAQWSMGTAVKIEYAGTVQSYGYKPCLIRWGSISSFGLENKIGNATQIFASTITLSPNISSLDLLKFVLTHEMGHSLGLEHLSGGRLMYPSVQKNGVLLEAKPNIVDFAAVTSLYPLQLVNGKPYLACNPVAYSSSFALVPSTAGGAYSYEYNPANFAILALTPLSTTLNLNNFSYCGN